MWYAKYKKLNPELFLHENSGNNQRIPPPYREKRNADFDTIGIYGEHGMDQQWKVLGYSERLPYYGKGYESVGIMFENQTTFEKVWFHYSKE